MHEVWRVAEVVIVASVSVMKARIIHTKFYASERVLGLSQQARWLFMYYLTCDGIGLTGAFKWSTSKTIFETGLDAKGLVKAKNELQSSKLAYFHQDWVIIPGTDEKNNFNSGSKTSSGYQKELGLLPQTLKDLLLSDTEENTPMIGVSEYAADADTPRIQNTENRNKKLRDESVREGSQQGSVLVEAFNKFTGKSLKSSLVFENNLEYWLKIYTVEEIVQALEVSVADPYWREIITPEILLRKKDKNGADVDRVGQFLAKASKTQIKPKDNILEIVKGGV